MARRSSRSTSGDGRPGRRSSGRTRERPPRREELSPATGLEGWSLGGLPAALWVERHEPEVAAATRWYLATWDFLALRLTGRAATSLARGPAVPDADGRSRAAGIPDERTPDAVRAGDVVGELTPDAASLLGIAPAIPVVAGIVDAWASFHGAGMTAKRAMRSTSAGRRVASASTGTSPSVCPGHS